MNLLWRYPQHPGCLRFHQGTIIIGGLPNQECFFEHPIKRWYGISFGRSFIGIILTGPTIDVREAPKKRAQEDARSDEQRALRDIISIAKDANATDPLGDIVKRAEEELGK